MPNKMSEIHKFDIYVFIFIVENIIRYYPMFV